MNKILRALKIKQAFIGVSFILLICNTTACKKLDIESSHLVNEDNNWQSITDARSALLGNYGLMRAALANNNAHWLYGEIRMGDFKSTSRLDLKAIIKGELNAPYEVIEDLSNWRRFYAVINSTSIFIDRAEEILNKDPQYTENTYKVDVAQMRALRAFCYFYMVRIWGDVPLIKNSRDGDFHKIKSSSSDVVLDFAMDELKTAVKDLPYVYGDLLDKDNPGLYYEKKKPYWDGKLFNKISAYCIMAHVAAWQSNYLDTEIYSDFVLQNFQKTGAAYVSTANLTESNEYFFGSKASHLIGFPFDWSSKEISVEGHIEDLVLASPLITRPIPQLRMDDETISMIYNEQEDQRFFIDAEGVVVTPFFSGFGGSNTIFSKIKCIRDASSDGSLGLFSSALVVSRIEEIALLNAEANFVLKRMDAATTSLNKVRTLRGLLGYKGEKDDPNLLDAIFTERKRELIGEGWWWYDLVRYNRIKHSIPEIEAMGEKGIYWPIAESVLVNNELLNQNSYWN